MENTKKSATHPKKARYTSQKACYTCRYTSKKLAIHAAIHPKSLLYICYTSLPSLLLVARIRYTLRHRCYTLAIHLLHMAVPPTPPKKTQKNSERMLNVRHCRCMRFFISVFFPTRQCRCMCVRGTAAACNTHNIFLSSRA